MNKNAFVYVFVVILIIIAGTYVWHSSKTKEHISNGEMLKSAKNTPITTIENLEYFPGAKGYFAEPKEKGNYPGIVVIHENRGLRPETKFTVEQLAKEGYMVLAVDLLGKTVETQEEARALAQTFSQATGTKNMQAAFDYLQKRGATKVASLGWCFGGAQSLQLALSGTKLDATVIYYGRLATTTKALSPITWPVLGIFGDKDTVISTSSVDQFKKALAELGIKHEIYMYEGVGHAFANPSGSFCRAIYRVDYGVTVTNSPGQPPRAPD
jgi:carboxymethylenebutenolidase